MQIDNLGRTFAAWFPLPDKSGVAAINRALRFLSELKSYAGWFPLPDKSDVAAINRALRFLSELKS